MKKPEKKPTAKRDANGRVILEAPTKKLSLENLQTQIDALRLEVENIKKKTA